MQSLIKNRDKLGNTIQGIFAMQQLPGHKFQQQRVKQWLLYEAPDAESLNYED